MGNGSDTLSAMGSARSAVHSAYAANAKAIASLVEDEAHDESIHEALDVVQALLSLVSYSLKGCYEAYH